MPQLCQMLLLMNAPRRSVCSLVKDILWLNTHTYPWATEGIQGKARIKKKAPKRPHLQWSGNSARICCRGNKHLANAAGQGHLLECKDVSLTLWVPGISPACRIYISLPSRKALAPFMKYVYLSKTPYLLAQVNWSLHHTNHSYLIIIVNTRHHAKWHPSLPL